MDFSYSQRTQDLLARLRAFMDAHIYPNEPEYLRQVNDGDRWKVLPLVEELKQKSRAAGLWNLFMTGSRHAAGLTNLEYAPLAEEMGRVAWASETFNCSAPDTGNMEVLAQYGTPEQQSQWLEPLLEGRIRSAYAMTEPDAACSDAMNIQLAIERAGGEYVLSGRKWWVTGAADPRCRLYVVMGRSGHGPDRHREHSVVLVPAETPGVRVMRTLNLFGYDGAPHGHAEVVFEDVRVPAANLVLGEGRGFEIAQGRLGPGRIHHCMRSIGVAERALELMCRRLLSREAFGRTLAEHGVWRDRVAEARCQIDMARLLTLKAAATMDEAGNKAARKEIAMIKAVAPTVACRILDWAMQAHGAAGIGDDFGLASMYAFQRGLRIADGPDEVHRDTVARFELARHRFTRPE